MSNILPLFNVIFGVKKDTLYICRDKNGKKLMRKTLFLLLILLISTQLQAQNTQDSIKKRPKVAVVLSGGGAKGAAHIGALKVLEQANIPIDIICGTSMGALMGGLYSIGYDSHLLDSLIRSQDWSFLLSDRLNPNYKNITERNKEQTYILSVDLNNLRTLSANKQGFIKGKNLSDLFTKLTIGYHDSISFDSLPIRFSAVATDMVDYKEVDFHSGSLITAMRSSMSIPGVFSPIKLDSMILVDGGLMNNFPTDVAKQMGADIIIGISVQNLEEKSAEDFKNTLSLVNQLLDANTSDKLASNLLLCDVFIPVNVKGYSAASFNKEAIDTLIQRGEDAAMSHLDEIMEIKQRVYADSSFIYSPIDRYKMWNNDAKIKLNQVQFRHIDNKDTSFLSEKFGLIGGDSIEINQIDKAINALRGTLLYNDALYRLKNTPNGYNLMLESEGKKAAELSMAVRFDNEEKVSLQFNGVLPIHFIVPILLESTIRLGERQKYHLSSTFNPSSFSSFTVSYTMFRHNIDMYYKGDKNYNVTANQHQLDFGTLNYGFKNFLFDVFLRWDYLDYRSTLWSHKAVDTYFQDGSMFSYNVKLHYNSLDDKYFPTNGSQIEASYGLYTDNFYQYKGKDPLHITYAKIKTATKLSDRLTLSPTFYNRMIFGNDVPLYLYNFVGGEFDGHYLEQQIPFAGICNIEHSEKTFFALNIGLKECIVHNNYLGFDFTIADESPKLKDIIDKNPFWGVRLSYSYNSIIGPVGASFGYSSRTKELNFFINFGYEF